MSTTVLKTRVNTIRPSLPPPAPSGYLAALLPASLLPYAQVMRLDRPAGLYAFYAPYLMGLALSACLTDDLISPTQLGRDATTYLVWCVILRGYTCTWNDNVDQEFDRKVARCRNRPIARGAISTSQAHLFTMAQMAVGLVFAAVAFPSPRTCMIVVACMTGLYALYPFGKRFTNYPQLILGFPFSGGIILPCYAHGVDPFVTRELAIATLALCLANIFWTMISDTIYAHQDLKDDLKAGVKSMSVRFRHSTKPLCALLGVGQVLLLVFVGILLDLSSVYYTIACFGTALSLFSMVSLVNLQSPISCAWWFHTDFCLVGGSISAGILAEYASTRLKW
ncbi:hypothetical protein N0V82_007387 [Gnomoniopsis sp. IMI 355080]|nr:hypothetical protein N0V82_007387 [Gnomoniopsis sp. IMI 355080]